MIKHGFAICVWWENNNEIVIDMSTDRVTIVFVVAEDDPVAVS